jgi:hypothetical protein
MFQSCRESQTHISCSTILFENRAFYVKTRKSILEPGMQQIKISSMHNLCLITKGTNTHAAPNYFVNAQLDLLYKWYVVTSFWQLRAEKFKQLFCTIGSSLMMGQ